MAQVAQVAQGRNTNRSRPCKSRNWQFTLNNYTEEEIKTIQVCGHEYIFQEETGLQGTKHLQGGLFCKNAISFYSIKKIIPRGHIEVCKNKFATINYCQKGETRTGKVFTNMEVSILAQKVEQHRPCSINNIYKCEKCKKENDEALEFYYKHFAQDDWEI